MAKLTWTLVTGRFAHTHADEDPLNVASGSAHFHGSAPLAHRHPVPGAPAEVYDRLATARWLLQCEVRQILWEQGLLPVDAEVSAPRVV